MHVFQKLRWMVCVPLLMFIFSACACKGPANTQTPTVGAGSAESTTEATRGITAEGCARTGCSGHICANAGEDIVSTCVWREEYACYKTARCEKQTDGKCGWTPSAALSDCLSSAKAK